jgi:hypothetical protein
MLFNFTNLSRLDSYYIMNEKRMFAQVIFSKKLMFQCLRKRIIHDVFTSLKNIIKMGKKLFMDKIDKKIHLNLF